MSGFIIEAVPGGYLAHGMCSVGPVHAMGLTESMARAKAMQQIRDMHSQHLDQVYAECRARFPDYFKKGCVA